MPEKDELVLLISLLYKLKDKIRIVSTNEVFGIIEMVHLDINQSLLIYVSKIRQEIKCDTK